MILCILSFFRNVALTYWFLILCRPFWKCENQCTSTWEDESCLPPIFFTMVVLQYFLQGQSRGCTTICYVSPCAEPRNRQLPVTNNMYILVYPNMIKSNHSVMDCPFKRFFSSSCKTSRDPCLKEREPVMIVLVFANNAISFCSHSRKFSKLYSTLSISFPLGTMEILPASAPLLGLKLCGHFTTSVPATLRPACDTIPPLMPLQA